MSVELKPFSALMSPQQAQGIVGLVKQHDYLGEYFDGIERRYSSLLNGMKNVIRATQDPILHAYIIREERKTMGVATIIPHERVKSSLNHFEFEGNNLDYWAVDASDVAHGLIAQALLEKSKRVSFKIDGESYPPSPLINDPGIVFTHHKAFALMGQNSEFNRGLSTILGPLSEPQVWEISGKTEDRYHIISGQVETLMCRDDGEIRALKSTLSGKP